MRRSVLVSAATLILCASPAVAHRIDEYLQAATLLVSSGRLQLELRLAPGSEIARKVLESIDLNRDGDLELRLHASPLGPSVPEAASACRP